MNRITLTRDQLPALIGQEVAVSDWMLIDQERIDRFAEATGDRQWIHVDRERAARESPFGGTIAHGFLTLSLIAAFKMQTVEYAGARMGINLGTNRVRFPAPVPVDSRLRGRFRLDQVQDVQGGVQTVFTVTVEREGGERPVCVAELVSRILY